MHFKTVRVTIISNRPKQTICANGGLSCYVGSDVRDLWSLYRPDEKDGITYELIENDCDLVHDLVY